MDTVGPGDDSVERLCFPVRTVPCLEAPGGRIGPQGYREQPYGDGLPRWGL